MNARKKNILTEKLQHIFSYWMLSKLHFTVFKQYKYNEFQRKSSFIKEIVLRSHNIIQIFKIGKLNWNKPETNLDNKKQNGSLKKEFIVIDGVKRIILSKIFKCAVFPWLNEITFGKKQ